MRVSRRAFVVGGAAALTGCTASSSVEQFQSLPENSTTLIVPAPAASRTGLVGKAMGEALARELKRPVSVVHMDPPPRAYDTMAKAPADGRVLGLIASDMSVHRLKGASAAGPSEVTPLAMVAHDPAAVHVRASGGWSSIAELTDDLRKRGAAAPVAAVASGAIWHLSATHWLASAKADPKALGVDVVATVDPAVEGLVDGKYDVLVCSVPEVRGLSQGKGVRTLGVMSPQRHSRYPDVPSLKEAGIAIDAGFWRGVCLPAGASAAVVASLGSAVRAAQASSEYRFALRRKGFEPRYSSGAPLKAFLDADFAAKSAILKA